MRHSRFFFAAAFACGLLAASHAGASHPDSAFVVHVPAGSTLSPSSSTASAKQFLVRHAALPPQTELLADRTLALHDTTVFRFDQMHLGVPVFARGAGVAVDPQGKVILAASRIESQLPSSVAPALTAGAAAAIASQLTGVPALEANARLVIIPSPWGGVLAWMVHSPVLLPALDAPIVTVDATSGAVIGAVNAVRFKNNANVFTINPVEDNGVTTTVQLAVPDPNTSPDNADLVSYNCVDNGTMIDVTSSHGTRKVHICDLVKNASADAVTGDYTAYEPGADDEPGDPFAEIQMFYHANKAFEFFRSFDGNDGFKLAPSDSPLFVVANWMTPARGPRLDAGVDAAVDPSTLPLKPYQNAAYMPFQPGATGTQTLTALYPQQITGGVLQFGQGVAADYAYDGEVVYHEFTHAVVNATLNLVPYWHLDSQGGTASPGALNEGLADFFSAAISGKAALGTYAVKDMQADGLNLTCIRDLDNANTCPHDMAGEVHTDSVFFTGALWKARSQLATEAERKLFAQTMFTVMATIKSGDLGYEELAEAFVTALASTMGQPVATLMDDEFAARGILPRCDRTIVYAGTPLRGTDPLMSFMLTSPGTMNFNTALPYAPSFFQVEVPIPAGAKQIIATFKAQGGGGYGGGSAFTPAFLVHHATPVVFSVALGHSANTTTIIDASAPVAPTPDGGIGDASDLETGPSPSGAQTYTAHIAVPEGTTASYLMLINKGASDSYFIDLTFATSTEPVPGEDTDAGVDAETDGGLEAADDAAVTMDGGTQDDASAEASQVVPEATGPDAAIGGGCGCRSARAPEDSSLAVLLLGSAGFLAKRRHALRPRAS